MSSISKTAPQDQYIVMRCQQCCWYPPLPQLLSFPFPLLAASSKQLCSKLFCVLLVSPNSRNVLKLTVLSYTWPLTPYIPVLGRNVWKPSCLKWFKSKLWVINRQSVCISQLLLSQFQWAQCIRAKRHSVKQCVRCESCGSKESSVKSSVQGTVPSIVFMKPVSAFRVELQKTWQSGTVREIKVTELECDYSSKDQQDV